MDIWCEAGLSHVGDRTVFPALAPRGIHAYHEEFKPILRLEQRLNQFVTYLVFLFVTSCPREPVPKKDLFKPQG